MLGIIDIREKIEVIVDECSICCYKNKCIICAKCSHVACIYCIKKFVITTDTTECFHCSVNLSDEFLNVIFEKEYVEVCHNIDDELIDKSDNEELEKPKNIIRKLTDNRELMEFRKEKFFNMSKMLFSEDLKYITVREEFLKLEVEYKEFLYYRFQFLKSLYYKLLKENHIFLKTVREWYNLELTITAKFYSRKPDTSPYVFMNMLTILSDLNVKIKTHDGLADECEKYGQMNLRLVNMIIMMDRHINILNKCKRDYNSFCNISKVIKVDGFTNCKTIYKENTLDLRMYADDGEMIDNVEEATKVIIGCPAADCSGFLNNYKCIICLQKTCSICLSIHDRRIGEIYNDNGCKNEDIETLKLIKSDSKKCPKCGIAIYKTEGCNQMWCTNCHTGFSWKTGKIETNIHNPHYFEWLEKTSNSEHVVVPESYRFKYATLNGLYDYIIVYRSNVFIRFRYLIGEIDKNKFCTLIYNIYKSNEFNRKFRELIDVTIETFVEMANSNNDKGIEHLRLSFNEILDYYENVYNIGGKKYHINDKFEYKYL